MTGFSTQSLTSSCSIHKERTILLLLTGQRRVHTIPLYTIALGPALVFPVGVPVIPRLPNHLP